MTGGRESGAASAPVGGHPIAAQPGIPPEEIERKEPGEAVRFEVTADLPVPAYLQETYWWAYLHPRGVRFFERQWIVNLILWGNFAELRDAALAEIDASCGGRTLQVACVYGDFTPILASRIAPTGRLDVVDVAPVQLTNLSRKLGAASPQVFLHHQDSTRLEFADGTFDNVVVFFLLHEQPEEARTRTVHEAVRVTRPQGRVIFVDYHQPYLTNPFRYVMIPVLASLEPFALDMWQREIVDWVPPPWRPSDCRKETYFGGLYQKVVMVR
ncbi:MAG: class I SAM-dependent methyltransferase [Magnetococcales bacterium]|nr:class I SAM-dependent methyltransferase [Magnetococcales bacterium]